MSKLGKQGQGCVTVSVKHVIFVKSTFHEKNPPINQTLFCVINQETFIIVVL